MQTVDTLIIHAKQLITCASDGKPKRGQALRDVGIIKDGAIAIHAGRIVAVGTTSALRSNYQASEVMDATGQTVCPAFVDCHTHAVYGGNRLDEFEQRLTGKSYMQILAEGGGILSTMQATRTATHQDLLHDARARLNQMLREGTTTAEIKTGYGLDTDSETKMLAVIAQLDREHPMRIVPTFLGAHAVPPEFASAIAYADYVLADMLPAIERTYRASQFAQHNVPLAIDIFCEAGVFDLATTQRILTHGKNSYGMPIKAHVDEFVNLGGVPACVALGALSVDHLDVTPLAELEILARSQTAGVFLPAVNFNLASQHYGNARAFAEMGGILALSTDLNPGSAPTPSLPMVMAIACRYQRLTPAEALNAVTINAAHALALGHEVGSLEVGKHADIVLLQTGDYRALAYEFGAHLIQHTLIGGKTAWQMTSS